MKLINYTKRLLGLNFGLTLDYFDIIQIQYFKNLCNNSQNMIYSI